MVQRTFYALPTEAPPEEPEAVPAPDGVDTLRYGYTLGDLDQIARMAVARLIGWGDRQTMYGTAWSAAAEYLYTTGEPPARGDVVHAAQSAVLQAARADKQTYGRGATADGTNDTRPRFASYWDWTTRPTGGPESTVVDRVALWQILPRLPQGQADALRALAAHGTYQDAAAALGLTYGSFQVQVSRARVRFLQLWHEGEEPSQVWGVDRRVTAGGALADRANGRASKSIRRRAGKPKRQPEHGKLSTYTTHGCRCDPCLEAAATHRDQRRQKRRAKTGASPKKVVTEAQKQEIRDRVARGERVSEIAAALGLSEATVYRQLRASVKGRKADAA